MQNTKKTVKDFLEKHFTRVKETETGFKVPKDILTGSELKVLSEIPEQTALIVKRSGTGLVLIVHCNPTI